MELSFIVSPKFDGSCLRDFLRASGVSASLIKAVKNHTGGFWVEDGPARTCDPIHTGQMVTFVLPPEKPTSVSPQDIPLNIVYESEHAMVLEKPAGMAIHPTFNYSDGTLGNAYMGLLQSRGQQGVFRPVNRIDKDTSGLVLCAKNMYAAPLLAGSVQKVYHAILQGKLPQTEGDIIAPIARQSDSIILRCVREDGKPSHTHYTVEQVCGEHTLVAAVPITGRTHQLRVHFAWMGCPLAGDEMYGGEKTLIQRHALHCSRMEFVEPVSNKKVVVESPLPADMKALLQ